MRQPIRTPTELGDLLRRRRKALGGTQVEVAARLGISQGRYSTLENDPASMPLTRLLQLTKLLGLELVLRDAPESDARA